MEPNNFNNEDAAGINLGPTSFGGTLSGQWGDTDAGGSSNVDGYIVEFVPLPASGWMGLALIGVVGADAARRTKDKRGAT